MTYTELKAQPGDYVFDKDGLAIGRINNDLTEDNRFTAFGKCSIANGFIKATNLTPTDARRFHKAVEKNPNGYVLRPPFSMVILLSVQSPRGDASLN